MGDVFLKLLNMSITAGWLILAVLCFRVVFKKVPKWVNCLLWAMVALRLLCPFTIESPFSLIATAEPIKSSEQYIPFVDTEFTIIEDAVNPVLAESFSYEVSDSAAPLQIYSFIAGIVWCLGGTALLLYAVISTIRLRLLVREAVRYSENIYLCDRVSSPFILGVFRPQIYLPSDLAEDKMEYILAHEYAHISRKDHWWKPIGYLLLCIYWFQPLCWAAYVYFCKDIELACDEKVVRKMSLDEKKDYSKVLLSCVRIRKGVMTCPLAFGEVGVKERIKRVLQYKKPGVWVLAAAVLIILILAVGFLTSQQPDYEEEVMIAETYEKDPQDESVYLSKTYHKMSDGSWECEGYSYKYKLTVSGVMNMAEKGTIYTILSNREAITFDEAWKAAGFSSNMDDYFEKEDAVIVEVRSFELPETTAEKEEVFLHEQIQSDQVNIRVQPSVYREQLSYYYVPCDEEQTWIKEQLDELDLTGGDFAKKWQGQKDAGWEICYNGIELRAFESGCMYYTYSDETGIKECLAEAPELYSYIRDLLIRDLAYEPFDPADIQGIKSATLEIATIFTDWEYYTQTITDSDKLELLESWLSGAEYKGGADCGSNLACLELVLDSGDIVRLSMATDSCSIFGTNGVYYDYRPEAVWDNREFYQLFDEIPNWN